MLRYKHDISLASWMENDETHSAILDRHDRTVRLELVGSHGDRCSFLIFQSVRSAMQRNDAMRVELAWHQTSTVKKMYNTH